MPLTQFNLFRLHGNGKYVQYRKQQEQIDALGDVSSEAVNTNALSDAFATTEKQELTQWSFSSGVIGSRQYTAADAFDPKKRVIDASYAVLNIHNHGNYYGMNGIAEIAVLINGIYYRSRHNDYRHKIPVPSTVADGMHRPKLVVEENSGHYHIWLFPLTEQEALDLIDGVKSEVIVETRFEDTSNHGPATHYHEISVTWDGSAFQAVQVPDSTGHTHPITVSFYSTEETDNTSDYVPAPDMPDAIKALPTGVDVDTGAIDFVSNTQAKYLKEIWTENPQDIEMTLAYVEMWFELVDPEAGVPDAGDSFRHAELAGSLNEAYRRSTRLTASGHKDRQENISVGPALVVQTTEDGNPIYANPVFRFSCKVIGNMADVSAANMTAPTVNVSIAASHGHVVPPLTDQEARDLVSGAETVIQRTSYDDDGTFHTHDYDITWNGSEFVAVQTDASGHTHELLFSNRFGGNIPYDRDKAIAGTVDDSNWFTLVRDLHSMDKYGGDLEALIDSRRARFYVKDLDRMCESVPGLDGEGAFIVETHTNPDDNSTDTLSDRDNLTLPMNAAYYNRRYQYSFDASGRRVTDRGFNDANLFVAKTNNPNVINGYTYMIPVEIVARSPIEKWNPHGIPQQNWQVLQGETSSGKGDDSGNPYSGYYYRHYYMMTPYGMYTDPEDAGDAADTRKKAWVENENGVAVQVWNSGINVFTHDLAHRQRFPCYPLAQEFSHESIQLAHFKDIVKDLLQDIRTGAATYDSIDKAF